jgi:hypothetical protein
MQLVVLYTNENWANLIVAAVRRRLPSQALRAPQIGTFGCDG